MSGRWPAAGRELTLDDDLLDRLIEHALPCSRRLGAEPAASTPWTSCAGPASCARPSATRPRSPRRRPRCSPRRSRPSPPRARAKASASRRCFRSRARRRSRPRRWRSRRALPEVQSRIRAKMPERLAALGAEVNPERLEQEIAILVQKMDVAEELDRLKSHVTELTHDARLGRRGRPQARFPDAGIQPRGEHAVVEVTGRRDDALGGRVQGADRADAGAGSERRVGDLAGLRRLLNASVVRPFADPAPDEVDLRGGQRACAPSGMRPPTAAVPSTFCTR